MLFLGKHAIIEQGFQDLANLQYFKCKADHNALQRSSTLILKVEDDVGFDKNHKAAFVLILTVWIFISPSG